MTFDLGYASSTRFFCDLNSGVVITVGSFLTPRRRFILKWTYPPLGWGLGAALVAWLGVIELDTDRRSAATVHVHHKRTVDQHVLGLT